MNGWRLLMALMILVCVAAGSALVWYVTWPAWSRILLQIASLGAELMAIVAWSVSKDSTQGATAGDAGNQQHAG